MSDPYNPFPSLESASESGVLAVSHFLDIELLVQAYSQGIFPWPNEDLDVIPWFYPQKRAVLESSKLHISKSLKKALHKADWEITINKDFRSVIKACSNMRRKNRKSTWISSEVITHYTTLHEMKLAHSFECWEKDNLIGGLYGVCIGGFFSGESMFFYKDNASKLCLMCLALMVNARGPGWIDCQISNQFLKGLGVLEISSNDFEIMQKNALYKYPPLFKGLEYIDWKTLQT